MLITIIPHIPHPRFHPLFPPAAGSRLLPRSAVRPESRLGAPLSCPRAFFPSASLSPASTPSNRRRLVPLHYPPLSRPLGHAPAVLLFPLRAGCGGRAALRAAITASARVMARGSPLPPSRCPLVVPLPPVPPFGRQYPRAGALRPAASVALWRSAPSAKSHSSIVFNFIE